MPGGRDRFVEFPVQGLLGWCALLFCLVSAGCGTTRRSDTGRTALEQLLISDAVDQAVAQIDLSVLAGKPVYFESQFLGGTVDEKYLVSTIRQHLLHHGCILKESRDDATYVVEARAGAIGTNRHDLMVGIPAINLPSAVVLAGVPSSIPEVPIAKSTDQKGVAKIALFAYNRETGRGVWQSGTRPVASRSKDMWILGAGPFQRGSIYDGTRFAGSNILLPLAKETREEINPEHMSRVTDEVFFSESRQRVVPTGDVTSVARRDKDQIPAEVITAAANEPIQQPAPESEATDRANSHFVPPSSTGQDEAPRLLQAEPAVGPGLAD